MMPASNQPNRFFSNFDVLEWHDLTKFPEDLPKPDADGNLRPCILTIKDWTDGNYVFHPEGFYNSDVEIEQWVVLSTLENGHMPRAKAAYREPAGDVIAWAYQPNPYMGDQDETI